MLGLAAVSDVNLFDKGSGDAPLTRAVSGPFKVCGLVINPAAHTLHTQPISALVNKCPGP
jgi:hypothetical protein